MRDYLTSLVSSGVDGLVLWSTDGSRAQNNIIHSPQHLDEIVDFITKQRG
jgi:hypothetical protein